MTWQKGSKIWRCGLRRDHDGEHGEYVRVEIYKKQKWRCGFRATAPAPVRVDARGIWRCPAEGCERRYTTPAKARAHWYNHLRVEVPWIADHGTERGYENHRRRQEEACAPCKAAHSRGNSRRRSEWVNRHPKSGMDF